MKANLVFSPVVRPRAELRLFCFPYAGGNASIFHRWPDRIDPRVEVVCVEPPGRGNNWGIAPCFSTETLTPLLCQHILPWLDRPFAFFGHSNGALVAFELARTLQRTGHVPTLFIASAKSAPSLLDGTDAWHTLPDQELLTQLRKLGGTPDAFFDSPELQQLLLPTIRADFALSETYRYLPGEKLHTTPVLIGGTHDNSMDHHDQQAWASEFDQISVVHNIIGGHFFIDERPAALFNILNAELGKRLGRSLAA